jgi:hypothetical protein
LGTGSVADLRITGVVPKLQGLSATVGNIAGIVVGSGNLCVLWLPNSNYNQDVYHPKLALDARVACSSPESLAFFKAHAPPRKADSPTVEALLRRNYHIIHGDNVWPRVKFVIYNANEFAGNIPGGTRYGVAAAKEAGIPVVNIRWDGWRDRLHFILNNIPDTP